MKYHPDAVAWTESQLENQFPEAGRKPVKWGNSKWRYTKSVKVPEGWIQHWNYLSQGGTHICFRIREGPLGPQVHKWQDCRNNVGEPVGLNPDGSTYPWVEFADKRRHG